eukprot:676617-Pyramimonas_sp.AAC.1
MFTGKRTSDTTNNPPGVARLQNWWNHLRNLDFLAEVDRRTATKKTNPKCIRGPFVRILTECLSVYRWCYNHRLMCGGGFGRPM